MKKILIVILVNVFFVLILFGSTNILEQSYRNTSQNFKDSTENQYSLPKKFTKLHNYCYLDGSHMLHNFFGDEMNKDFDEKGFKSNYVNPKNISPDKFFKTKKSKKKIKKEFIFNTNPYKKSE